MITSRHNRQIKRIQRLRRCKGDHALLEGPHLLAEALASGTALESVLAAPDFLASPEGEALAARLVAPPLTVAPDVLATLMDADSPRGVLAVARLPRGGAESLPLRPGAVYLFLDGVQDPGNVGAIARTAEAAGAAGMALATGSAHPNHPRALRAAAGSLLRLPIAWESPLEALDRRLAPLSPRWAALVPRGGAEPWATELDGTLVLAVGAEGPGLSPLAAARADLLLTIPLEPPVESLNAAVAAAVVLFEARRRRTERD